MNNADAQPARSLSPLSPLSPLTPLETLYDASQGSDLPLPRALAALYGPLRFPFPSYPGKPHVISNFVTTLDGVVSLNVPGQAGGGEISGFNRHDQMVMGLLRAVADAVIVGAGTLRSVPGHLWTAEYVYPPLAEAYQELRAALGKREPPLNVIVSARGELDLTLRVFSSGEVPVLVITTPQGAARVRAHGPLGSIKVVEVGAAGPISARALLELIARTVNCSLVLVEGGPRLMGDFLTEGCLDEQFLTLAPQIAGRDEASERPGLVSGRIFAPRQPLWGTLTGVKRGGSHLFLRYSLEQKGR